jgi:NAD(P)-dependent dehydrogenase (short-subunit alcohol dehydrogenase family)
MTTQNAKHRFDNKVAVITGGTTGIGFAAARKFVAEGANVVITGVNRDRIQDAVSQLGSSAAGYEADVSNLGELDRLFDRIRSTHGRIDVLFGNAGIAKLSPVADTTSDFFDEIVNTNFKGAFFTAQKALPLLVDGGSIVFTTSYFTEVGTAGTSVVSASKAALRSLTRTLARELLDRKIRVNSVSPGVIETPLFGKLGLAAEDLDAVGKALLAGIPVQRFGSPDEVANAVAFLASDEAAYITGLDLAVDGGRTQI